MKYYIVIDSQGKPLELNDPYEAPGPKILLSGDSATLFTSYGKARTALKNTRKYEENNKCSWKTWAFKIMTCKVQE